MPKTIWKFQWTEVLDVSQRFQMPKGAEILALQIQRNQLCLWALVDPSVESEPRSFELCGTGHAAAEGKYIGTVQFYGGDLVLHCFETTKR